MGTARKDEPGLKGLLQNVGKRKNKRVNKRLSPWLYIPAIIIIISLTGYFSCRERTVEVSLERELPAERPTEKKVAPQKRMAIIIDDVGYDLAALSAIVALDTPITVSILPHCPYSIESAHRARNAGNEVMLHLPMEPHGYPTVNPGEGALLVSMSEAEIRSQTEKNIQAVPFISGVNNHMGSRFMECEKQVSVVFDELQKQGLFFLDSGTTKDTKGRAVSATAGIPYAKRDIFLDNGHNLDETVELLRHLIEKRDAWNTLIVIGHPYHSTVRALEATLPLIKEHGIDVVTLSNIIEN